MMRRTDDDSERLAAEASAWLAGGNYARRLQGQIVAIGEGLGQEIAALRAAGATPESLEDICRMVADALREGADAVETLEF